MIFVILLLLVMICSAWFAIRFWFPSFRAPSLNKLWNDSNQPLNYIIFQEPKTGYPEQLVNVWVKKPEPYSGFIPCTLEQTGVVPLDQRTLIIYSHGNGEDLGSCQILVKHLANALKVDVMAYDYSGYGANKFNSKERSAEGINATLRAVFEHAVAMGYQGKNIFLLGYSLGSGPSAAIAAEVNRKNQELGGLILFAAYTSITAVVADKSHNVIASMFTERWDTTRALRSVTSPVLILHGENDRLIGVKHARENHEANPNSTLVVWPDTGHCSFGWYDLQKSIADWLKGLNR